MIQYNLSQSFIKALRDYDIEVTCYKTAEGKYKLFFTLQNEIGTIQFPIDFDGSCQSLITELRKTRGYEQKLIRIIEEYYEDQMLKDTLLATRLVV